MYRRRPGDEMVAPFPVWLLLRVDGHVHGTVTMGTRAIPYVCSYTGKGDAHARVAIRDANRRETAAAKKEGRPRRKVDAIREYEDHRTTPASEAFARVLEFPLVMQRPFVKTMHVTGPLEDTVAIMPTETPGEAARRFVSTADRYYGRPDAFYDMAPDTYFEETCRCRDVKNIPKSVTAYGDKCVPREPCGAATASASSCASRRCTDRQRRVLSPRALRAADVPRDVGRYLET